MQFYSPIPLVVSLESISSSLYDKVLSAHTTLSEVQKNFLSMRKWFFFLDLRNWSIGKDTWTVSENYFSYKIGISRLSRNGMSQAGACSSLVQCI